MVEFISIRTERHPIRHGALLRVDPLDDAYHPIVMHVHEVFPIVTIRACTYTRRVYLPARDRSPDASEVMHRLRVVMREREVDLHALVQGDSIDVDDVWRVTAFDSGHPDPTLGTIDAIRARALQL